MRNIYWLIGAAVVIAAGSFVGGVEYVRFNAQSAVVAGTIVDRDASSMTLRLPDGSSKVIDISGHPAVLQEAAPIARSTDNLAPGMQVFVLSQNGAADTIHIRTLPSAPATQQ